jgi:hypothetical protein
MLLQRAIDSTNLNPTLLSANCSTKLYQSNFTGHVDEDMIRKPKQKQHLEYEHSILSSVPAALKSYCTNSDHTPLDYTLIYAFAKSH